MVKYLDKNGYTRQYTGIKYYNIQCKDTAPTIIPSALTIKVGETFQLKVSSVSSQSSVQWQSYYPTIARVSDSGLVTARKEGTGIIFATVPGLSSPLTCTLYVKDPRLTLKASPLSNEIERGTSIFLTASKSNAVIFYTLDGTDPEQYGNLYTGQITISTSGEVTLKAIAYDVDEEKEPSEVLSKKYTIIDPKLIITSNVNSGTVDFGTSVVLTSNAPEAAIYYTNDGTNPSTSSFQYRSPILVTNDITIKAIAVCQNYRNSDVLTLNYDVRKVKLSVTPEDNSLLPVGSEIKLTATPSDAEILYTTDGSDPTINGETYNRPIIANKSLKLKARAFKQGYMSSSILTANYNITSLMVVSANPGDGAKDLGRNTIPSISYNSEIQQGESFSDIKLINEDKEEVSGEIIITGNTLCFVPEKELIGGSYKLVIPSNSLESIGKEPNLEYEMSFEIASLNNLFSKVGEYRILKSDKTLYAWGQTSNYNYPSPSIPESFTPVSLFDNIEDFFDRRSVTSHYVLKTDGTLLGWGGNFNSAYNKGATEVSASCDILGDGTKLERLAPVDILWDVKQICEGRWHHGVIKHNNSLWLWGRNFTGEIGNGESDRGGQLSPVKVLDNVKEASLGIYHTAALTYDGSLWVWGAGSSIGASSNQVIPLKKMTDVKSIFGYDTNHVIALKNDGTVWTFGQNDYGQIGDGTTTNRTNPYKVLSDVKFIEANRDQNIAIKEDGSLWRWGKIFDYPVPSSERAWYTPKKILDDVKMARSAKSGLACYALTNDGSLWGMGHNESGELGNGTQDLQRKMIKIMDEVSNFWPLYSQVYIQKKDGSLWGCGSGPIGDGTQNSRLKPVKIMDGPMLPSLDGVEIQTDENFSRGLPVGHKLVFYANLSPLNGVYDNMVWDIENEDVASISPRGVVTAKSKGNTNITLVVKTRDKTFNCTHSLTVSDDIDMIHSLNNVDMNYNINGSFLCLTNLRIWEKVSVTNLTGVNIFNGISDGRTLRIPIYEKGIYILQVGNQTRKISKP